MSGDITTEIDLIHVEDHTAQLRAQVYSQFRSAPIMQALITAIGRGLQELEEVGFSLIVSRTLEAAAGAQLRQYGAIVGEAQGTLTDAEYRRFIQARIMVNVCPGNTDSILAIWELITNGTPRHRQMFPAGFQLETIRRTRMALPMLRRVRRMMEDVRPMAITMYRVEASSGGFGFGGSYTAFDAGGFARSF